MKNAAARSISVILLVEVSFTCALRSERCCGFVHHTCTIGRNPFCRQSEPNLYPRIFDQVDAASASCLRAAKEGAGPQRIKSTFRDDPERPRRRGKRRLVSSHRRNKNAATNILSRFRNGNEIDFWMEELVAEQPQITKAAKNIGPFPDASWSSRDETDFIRALRDRDAYEALYLYVHHFARKNVFISTAAIAAFANARTRRSDKEPLNFWTQWIKMESGLLLSHFLLCSSRWMVQKKPRKSCHEFRHTRIEQLNYRLKFSTKPSWLAVVVVPGGAIFLIRAGRSPWISFTPYAGKDWPQT
jgi:hypothetical protein